MHITPELKTMLGLLITVLVFRRVLMMENSTNYHEPILQNVTLYSIDNSASEVPLFMLKADSPTFQAICFRKSPAQQLMSFSLAICRTLGYDALQRVYSVDARLLDSMYHSKGLLLDINCKIPVPELQHCQWHHTKTVSCFLYLGVHCAECHRTVEITEDMEQEIIFPIHMLCYPRAYCDLNIRNNQIMKKAVLEFKKRNTDKSLPIASVAATAGEMLEVRWFDTGNGNWTTITETFTKFVNMGPIKIQSQSIMVRYFFVDCQFFDPTRITLGNIASLKYYNEEYVLQKAEAVSYFIPVALFTILMTFIMMLVTCACCYIRKRKQKMYSKHDFTMTYTPGLNVTYDEDETKLADAWPAVYHHLSLEDQNVCLSSLISNDSNKPITSKMELLMDARFRHAEPLRNAVTQFATQHRKSSVNAQKFGSEEEEKEQEEVFSCSSRGSLHSFHSAYPFAHNSVSSLDSFISIRSELQD